MTSPEATVHSPADATTDRAERLAERLLPDSGPKLRMLVIVNPYATTVSDRLRNLVVYALQGRYEVEAEMTEAQNHATEIGREAVDGGYDIVVAFGGDGTLNEVVNGLAGTGIPVSVLPGGSTNVVARSLGIPNDVVDATEHLLGCADDFQPRPIDLGIANGRRFVFSCGAGLDASAASQVDSHPLMKQRFGPWYYTWASVAAGLFVVVGLVTVLNQNLGGGDEGVFLAADQTTALLDAPTEEGAQSDAGGGDGAAPEITDDSGDGPTATTMAASESPPVAQLSAEAENLRQGEFAGDLEPYGEDATRSSAIEACVERANLNGYEVAALLTPSEDTAVSTTIAGDELDGSTTTTVAEVTEDRLAVAVPAGADPATAPVAFVDLTTCEVVYLDE